MRVSEILRSKPGRVVSLPPEASPVEAANLMRRETVGAVLVRDTHGRMLGVLAERDLAVALGEFGLNILNYSVGKLMSLNVPIAAPDDSVRDIIRTMTERRARHMPVIDGDTVVGVVSIGDVLKSRLAETALENAVLHDLARAHLAA